VRERSDIRGPDIYQDSTVNREVYSIRSTVLPGNSGGPLLSENGDAYGVIFAAAVDDSSTGYALTAAEAAPVADAGRGTTARVGTQNCD
ncbi:MAG: serine protease, partial [Mycobacteriales bacterium]